MKHKRKAKRQVKYAKPAPPVALRLPPKLLSDRIRKPGWWMLSALIFLFYLWTATSSHKPFHPRDTSHEFYNQFTDSLMQGHVYLPALPAPKLLALRDPYDPVANETLRLHDASLYHGRYYMYFGVGPALTLYVPWRILTGKRLSDDVAVTLFCLGGYVFSCLLLFLLLEACQLGVPWILQAAVVLALGLGQFAAVVLRRPRVYEVAISAAYCFLTGGLYFLARRVLRRDTRWWLLAVSATLLGLAAASRAQCGMVAILLAILLGFYLARVRGLSGRPWLKEIVPFVVPLAIAGLLTGWYNYARFGNLLEFGVHYQVGAINHYDGYPLLLRLRQALASLYYLWICLPNFKSRFPFLEMSGAAQPFGDPDLFPKLYYHEPVAGVLPIVPLCLAGFALPFLLWRRKLFTPDVRAILTGLIVCAFAMLAAVCIVPHGVSGRYALDFEPVFLIASLFLCLFGSVRLPLRWMRTTAAALTGAACLWAAAATMALSVNSYGYPLEQPYSPLFRSIATRFGAGPDAFMYELDTFHFEATITFPFARPQTRETILATGIWDRWDLFFVDYQEEGKAIFAFVHAGVSDTQTSPIPISPGTPHRLTMDYSAAVKRLVVRLDEKIILDYPTAMHPTARDEITMGRIRVGRFGVRNFSGKIDVPPNGILFVPRAT